MNKIFTKAFWLQALESAVVAGGTAFTGALTITTTPSLNDLKAAGTAAGVAFIYTFTKSFGASQVTNPNVGVRGPFAAPLPPPQQPEG